MEGPLAQCFIFNLIDARLLINTPFRKIKDEDFGLPGCGFGVMEADVIVSRVVVGIDFDVVTADIIAARGVLVPIECFHSRGQHRCKFIRTKESICIRKVYNSQRIGLGHQHGRRFIVLRHQYGRLDVSENTLLASLKEFSNHN